MGPVEVLQGLRLDGDQGVRAGCGVLLGRDLDARPGFGEHQVGQVQPEQRGPCPRRGGHHAGSRS